MKQDGVALRSQLRGYLLCLIYQICFTFASNQILDKAMKKTINFEFGRTFSCIPKLSLFFNLMKIDQEINVSDLRQNLERKKVQPKHPYFISTKRL